MSASLNLQSLPILRLTTPQIAVKHGALTNNTKFNTNLPLNVAMFIVKVSTTISYLDATGGSLQENYVVAQLSENTTLTAPSLGDPLAICSFARQYSSAFTAAGTFELIEHETPDQTETFANHSYPTLAQSLNLIASMTELSGSGRTLGFNVSMYIWYYLAGVDSALQAFLNQRLSLQR
jgi:hypothetical protein